MPAAADPIPRFAPPPPPASLPQPLALLLDFDGTLVEIADSPEAIAVPAGLPALLAALSRRLDGRLAIVSGRPLDEIRHHAGDGMAASGSHGAELALPGCAHSGGETPAWRDPVVAAFARLAEGDPGLLVETKPFGAALHYRRAPHREAECRALGERLADEHGIACLAGKMVVELRAAGIDKGGAVRALLATPAFAGAVPLFVGDDVTDEDGFRAAAECGGAGMLVGGPRASAARYRIENVAAVHGWLAAMADVGEPR